MFGADTLASVGVLTVFLGPPLVIIGLGLRYARATWRVRHRFAGTTATITGSRVAERAAADTEDQPSYRPEITFRYQVAGVEHASGVFAHRASMPSAGDAQVIRALVDRFPPGSSRPCWYDPGDPGVAYLERGTARDGSGLLVVGLVFLAAIVGLAVVLALVG